MKILITFYQKDACVAVEALRRGEYLSPEELLRAAGSTASVMPGTVADEIRRAQQAFAVRAYMIVVDNQCVWRSDAVLTLHAQTQVEFIKILPLVGG